MTKADPPLSHPRHQLDDAFMTPVRFSVMAALGPEIEIDFATLRDIVETEDSALSKAIAHLQRTGYVVARKGYVSNKPRTWVKATPAGLAALSRHIVALQAIAAGMTRNH